jgi:putative DNA primase/helicase
LAPLKNNIGDDATAFAFRIESATVGNGIDTSHVVFEPGTLTTTAAELLLGQSQTDEERGAQGEAEEFLRDMLKDGPVNSKFVKDAAKKAEIAPRTLDRARARLKVRAIKSDITGCWLMALPGSSGSDQLRQERQDRQERHVLSDEEIGDLEQERQEHPSFGGGGLGGVAVVF